jgi:hypothetical protein
MHFHVDDRERRQTEPEIGPRRTLVGRREDAELGAGVEQVRRSRILEHDAEIDEIHENFGAPARITFGATFVHVLPPSRVSCTFPSSVPAQTTFGSFGL